MTLMRMLEDGGKDSTILRLNNELRDKIFHCR